MALVDDGPGGEELYRGTAAQFGRLGEDRAHRKQAPHGDMGQRRGTTAVEADTRSRELARWSVRYTELLWSSGTWWWDQIDAGS
jgi:hypothetical protein